MEIQNHNQHFNINTQSTPQNRVEYFTNQPPLKDDSRYYSTNGTSLYTLYDDSPTPTAA